MRGKFISLEGLEGVGKTTNRTFVESLLNERKIAPVMDSIFPLSQASAAHERMEESGHIGKIVLEID